MLKALERIAYISTIFALIAHMLSSQWRELDAKEVTAAAILKVADMTEDYGNLDVSVRHVYKKAGDAFVVSGNTFGSKSVVAANGFRQNVFTYIDYEVDMNFWCTKQVETCANFTNIKMVGNNEHMPAL